MSYKYYGGPHWQLCTNDQTTLIIGITINSLAIHRTQPPSTRVLTELSGRKRKNWKLNYHPLLANLNIRGKSLSLFHIRIRCFSFFAFLKADIGLDILLCNVFSSEIIKFDYCLNNNFKLAVSFSGFSYNRI